MAIAFIGRGLGMVAATPSPVAIVTPKAIHSPTDETDPETFRILTEGSNVLNTEIGNRLRTE
tara:strand:+ start:10504 stop:10689 length:186 start_codon:yes stop_codon:yes gene_type:complete